MQLWDFTTGNLIETVEWGETGNGEPCKLYTAQFSGHGPEGAAYMAAGGSGANEVKVFETESKVRGGAVHVVDVVRLMSFAVGVVIVVVAVYRCCRCRCCCCCCCLGRKGERFTLVSVKRQIGSRVARPYSSGTRCNDTTRRRKSVALTRLKTACILSTGHRAARRWRWLAATRSLSFLSSLRWAREDAAGDTATMPVGPSLAHNKA